MSKILSAPTTLTNHADKRDITGTNNEILAKRGLDVNVVNTAPVEIVDVPTPGSTVIERGEALSVAKDIEVDILVYAVPFDKRFLMERISVTGDNRCLYRLYINGILKEDKNTWWNNFNAEFKLDQTEAFPNQIIRVTCEHYSNNGAGDFSATLKGSLSGS